MISPDEDQRLAQEAAEKSVYRKNVRKAREELISHFNEVIGPLEQLRGLSEIIAKKNKVSTDDLWRWVIRELTD